MPMLSNDLQARRIALPQRDDSSYVSRSAGDVPLRCSTTSRRSWYIKTTAKKDRLVSGNLEVTWYPEYIKYGRFGDWLENNVDWAVSRERYWGTPLPVWECPDCGQFECVGSRAELGSKPNVQGYRDDIELHRPYVDAVTFACGKCGGTMRRAPEVLDCWFDSGAMTWAQWHYPFENQDTFAQMCPGRLHHRGHRPDAGMVLQPACVVNDAFRRALLQEPCIASVMW